MAMTLTVNAAPSGGQKALTAVTVTVAGAANSTAYVLSIATPAGHTQTVPFVTNGSGAATPSFVPQAAGSYTINAYLAAPASQANTTLNAGGHS